MSNSNEFQERSGPLLAALNRGGMPKVLYLRPVRIFAGQVGQGALSIKGIIAT